MSDPVTTNIGLKSAGLPSGFDNPFVAAATGGPLGVIAYGKFKANQDEAFANEQNASFFEEQGRLAGFSAERELDIFNRESRDLIFAQESAFRKNGINFSSSASAQAIQADTAAEISRERQAIQKQNEFTQRLFQLRANQARGRADQLRSTKHNLLDVGGSVLSSSIPLIGAF